MDFQPPSSSGSKVVMDMGICPGIRLGNYIAIPYNNLQIRIFFYSKYFPLLCVPGRSAHAHRNYLGLSVVPIQHYNLLQSVEYFGTIMDC